MKKIHIFGAAGSGTTTLGRNLSEVTGYKHLDTDEFFWEDPGVFERIRVRDERIALIKEAMCMNQEWVLSGSLIGWGDVFIPEFDLAVFLYLPQHIRIRRIRARELKRYGTRIEPGGVLEQKSIEFVEWAAEYDDPHTEIGRSLKNHREWIANLPCPVLEITGPLGEQEAVRKVLEYMERAESNE